MNNSRNLFIIINCEFDSFASGVCLNSDPMYVCSLKAKTSAIACRRSFNDRNAINSIRWWRLWPISSFCHFCIKLPCERSNRTHKQPHHTPNIQTFRTRKESSAKNQYKMKKMNSKMKVHNPINAHTHTQIPYIPFHRIRMLSQNVVQQLVANWRLRKSI